jgi:hypothetical protein
MINYRVFCSESQVENLPRGLTIKEKYPAFVVVSGNEREIKPLRRRYLVEALPSPAETAVRAAAASAALAAGPAPTEGKGHMIVHSARRCGRIGSRRSEASAPLSCSR